MSGETATTSSGGEAEAAQELHRLLHRIGGPPSTKPFPSTRDATDEKRHFVREALLAQCRLEDNLHGRGLPFVPDELATRFLEKNEVRRLKKRSSRFPKAQFLCHLCSYHCDTLRICLSHVEDTRHRRLSRTRNLEATLRRLPPPNRRHLDALDRTLSGVAADVLIQPSSQAGIFMVAASLQEAVRSRLGSPLCQVRPFGSAVNGFGLRGTRRPVNLDLYLPDGIPPHLGLQAALEAAGEAFFNTKPDFFASKAPSFSFLAGGNVEYEVSLNNQKAVRTSRLLAEYAAMDVRVPVLGACFRHWAALCRIDRQREGTLPGHAFPVMLVHFLQQLEEPVLPCLHDHLKDGQEEMGDEVPKVRWKSGNAMGLGELWVGMFEYFALKLDHEATVVSVRRAGGLPKAEKGWKGKRLAVEDPFATKRPLTRSVSSSSPVFQFVTDCFQIAFLYFGCVQTVRGPVVTRIVVSEEAAAMPLTTVEELEREDAAEEESSSFESLLLRHGTELTPEVAKKVSDLVPRNMIAFCFDEGIFTAGESVPPLCTSCGDDGHLWHSCPDDAPIPVAPLDPPSNAHKRQLDRVCRDVVGHWRPRQWEVETRAAIVVDLSMFVRRRLWPGAVIEAFGSSINGFAFTRSDLDLSLSFGGRDDVDPVATLKQLGEELKHIPGVVNVQDITSAKVPIVKFTHADSGIECDVSQANVLGQENTRLLRFYCMLDPRVQELGYMAKLLAKVCGIGDASRGSLSSYAYVLMVLHYLQQIEPPVVPVLQELHPADEPRPVREVDGWNVWFLDDLQQIVNASPHLRKNCRSVGELWWGFLDYYARLFDERRHVVCVRRRAPLSKFEKMWTTPCFAIEDPFELSHNLGSGISRKMNQYIKKVFVNARQRFSMWPPNQGVKYGSQLFDPKFLTDGPPPNDRGCRSCGKIGHLSRDCQWKNPSRKQQKPEKKEDLSRRPSSTEEDGRSTPNIEETVVGANDSLMAMLTEMGITSPPHQPQKPVVNAEELESWLLSPPAQKEKP